MKNIWTITKKELRGYFNSPTAYVVMVAFLLLWEFLFFRGVFLVGQASLISLFDILPWIFLLFVPALTMGTISQERSQGTLEFILTRPIKELELIAGKFLSSLLFVAITLLFMFPIAWSLNKFGDIDWGIAFGQYLASVFMAMVFVALGIMVSSFFKSQISSLLTTAIAAFFLLIIGYDMTTARLPLLFVPYFEYSSITTHFSSMARGVISLRDAWYFVSAVAVFLSIAYLILLKNKYGTWGKVEKNLKIGIALIMAIVLFSNVGVSRFPWQADLTQEKVFTLSDSSKNILGGLDDFVDVTFYHSAQLPSQLQPVLRQVKDTLRDYETFSNGNVVVTEKNPSEDEEIATEALSAGIQEMQFNVVSQEELQIKSGYLGVSVSYGGEHESIPFIQDTDDLEYQLTSIIRKLTLEEKPKVVFLEGFGGKSLGTDYGYLQKELTNEYEVDIVSKPETTTPSEGEENAMEEIQPAEPIEIPHDTTVLVVAGPNQEIDEDTKGKIKKFAESGGSVLYLIDSVEVMPEMLSASENQNSFSEFLGEEYGITVNKDMVYDLKSNELVTFSMGGMPYALSYPFWINAIHPEESSIAKDIKQVTIPWASSLKIDDQKTSGLEIVELLTTTDGAGTQSGQFSIAPDQKLPTKGLSPKTIAVAGKSAADSAENIRFAIVGDSDFLTNNYTQNNPQNLGFGVEVISWLAQEESLTNIRLKSVTDRTMIFDNKSQPNTIKYGNMAFAFLLPAGFGTYRLVHRKKMRQYKYGQK